MTKEKSKILILNSGSTSLKFKIFDNDKNEFANGIIEKIGSQKSIIDLDGKIDHYKISDHKEALNIIKNKFQNIKFDFIVHRIVHGGSEFTKPVILNKSTIEKIEKYNDLAPLHNPINLSTAQESLSIWKNTKQYGAFDTMFFSTLEEKVYTYPINLSFSKKYNIRKFGFHGFSHQKMLEDSAKILKKNKNKCNLITCHLGGGSSISAIKNGKAIEISMGFTPNSGLMMLTRSGDIDSSIINFLNKKHNVNIERIDKMINFESGIKGISNLDDLRDVMILNGYKIKNYKTHIIKSDNNKKLAKLALNMFIYKIQRYISSYITLMPNIDAIVFSGGIGERNADIRKLIFKNLYIKNLATNKQGNIKEIVIKANEELAILNSIIKK
ncbi:MAG: acetate/propionate family kinase [Patescibacteria group bacterium]|nr:acetate/propionate family kinase [Patescibacteria group bacterium]